MLKRLVLHQQQGHVADVELALAPGNRLGVKGAGEGGIVAVAYSKVPVTSMVSPRFCAKAAKVGNSTRASVSLR
jgi:hypothetical protein